MPNLNISGTAANQTVADQASLAPFNGVQITNDLGLDEDVTITLSAPGSGILDNLGNGSYDTETGIYTDSGTPAAITADLHGLVFIPTSGVPGQSVTTTFTINAGGTLLDTATDSQTSVITIAGPAIIGTVPGQTTMNQVSVTPFFNVAIADDDTQTETLTVTVIDPASGVLSHLGNGSYNSDTGIYTTTGSATAVTNDIEGLIFTPTQGSAGQTVTTTFTISDTDTLSLTASDDSTSLDTTAGPSIGGTEANQTVSDQSTIRPFANVQITDDPTQTETVTVTLSDPAAGSLSGSVNVSYDADTGTYTMTGPITQVTADLQALVFTPAQGLSGQSVTTTFTINDIDDASVGISDSTTTVITTAGPTISGTVADQPVTDQMTIMPFANVVITDNVSEIETVTVSLSDRTAGSLSGIVHGSYDADSGVYTTTGSAAVVTTDLQGLVFVPTPGLSVTTSFTISDTDTDLATVTDSTTSVIATSTNVALNILGAVANQTVTTQNTIQPFSNVAIADDINQTETLTVTLSDPTAGSLSGFVHGSYDAGAGVYTTTGSANDVTNDIEGLVFTPAPGVSGHSVTTNFVITDMNGASLTVTDNVTSVTASAGPLISGIMSNQTAVNLTSVTPFAGVVITDDDGQTENVTVTLSNPLNGSLSGFANGSYDVGTGTYTTSGSATNVTLDIQGLIFTPANSAPGQSVTTTFTISDIDAAYASAPDVTTTLTASFGPSINNILANQSVTTLTTIKPFLSVVITDHDGQTENVTVRLSNPLNGSLSGFVNGSYDPDTGVYTTTGSAAVVTTDLQGLIFTPANGTPGHSVTTTFTISDIDDAHASAPDATTSVIAYAGPAINGTLSNTTVTDQTTITPFANVVIADDAGQMQTVMVTLSDVNAGSLSNLGNGSYDNLNGVYTTTGFVADVTTDLEALVFTPTPGIPGQGVTTGFTINDTDALGLNATDSVTSVIAVAGPAIGGTIGNQTITAQSTITPFAGVTVADDPSQVETVTVTLSNASDGSLSSLGNGSYDPDAGVYTTTGSAAAVATDLQGLIFTPTTGVPGQTVITTFTISDTDSMLINVIDDVTTVNTLAGPGISGTTAVQAVADQTPIMPFANVVIADDPSQTETVTVTLSNVSDGILLNLGTGSYDPNAGVYTASGTATDVTTDLQGLVFMPAQGIPGQSVTTTFTISDTDTVSITATNTATTVTAVAGPAIGGTSADQQVTDHTTITPFTGVVIADDAGQIETVTVTLSNALDGSLSNLGTGSYDPDAGVYTTSGSATAVTADLQGLVFMPAPGTPGHSVTTTFTISDTDSLLLNSTDDVTTVNTIAGPAISGTIGNQTITAQSTITPFAGVTVADDPSQVETVTVTLSNASDGSLSSLGNGSYDPDAGVYTTTGSAAAVATDLQGLIFTPTTGVAGHSVTTTFTISDTDSLLLNVTNDVTTVTAIAGPAISGTMADQSVTDQSTIMPFANVVIADDPSQTETVFVRLSNALDGSLSSLGNGSYDPDAGVYTTSGSAEGVTADLEGLVFTPAQGVPGHSVTTTFTISDTDTLSLSAPDVTASVTAYAGPAISGVTADQAVTDQTTITPFTNVVIADDPSQTETVTVTLSNALDGILSSLGNGSYDPDAGVYTTSGSATAVTADLQGLVFMPAPGIPGQSVTTTFTISDTDSLLLNSTDDVTTVNTIAAPRISGTTANQAVADQSTITPFVNVVITDDPSRTETVTVTLSHASDGSLSSLGTGSYDLDAGIYTTTGSAEGVTADLEGLVFTPAPGTPGHSVTTTFTISDTNDASLTGTNRATSVTAIAGPAINGAMANQPVTALMSLHPFANIVIADDISQTETVTVTLDHALNGSLSGFLNGSYDADAGTYTTTGLAADVTADLQGLVFIPTPGTPGEQSVTTTFTISDTDTLSLSAPDVTTSVTAYAGPAVSGATANQPVTALMSLHPFANIVIADDISQTETVTVTLDHALNGSLSGFLNGSYDADAGTYTTTGLAADVTADLQGLVFTPAPGTTSQSVTTTFTISDTDSLLLNASDSTTSVIATYTASNVAHVASDFNGDGRSDILYQNPTSGDIGYAASSAGSGQGTWIGYGAASTAYAVIGIGDFNADGASDILFRDAATGDTGYLANAVSGQASWVGLGASSTAYAIVGDNDFNGDGTADLLFRNGTTGDMGVYLLGAGGANTWQDLGSPSLLYSVVGTGDFNGSGKADILFQDTATGSLGYYQLGSGGSPGTWVGLGTASTAYAVVGVGDFNGDGVSDILFRNEATGNNGYLAMSANSAQASWVDLGISSTAYSVVAIGDFSGSGISDILFRNNATGDAGYYVPPSGQSQGAWHDVGTSSTAYHVVGSPTYG